MALIDDVSRGITEAMKSRDQDVLGTLRMLKSALTNKEIEKGRALDAAESLQVVSTLVKQRRDSIEQFTKGAARIWPTRRDGKSRSSSATCRRRPAPTPLPRRSPPPLPKPAPPARRTSAKS